MSSKWLTDCYVTRAEELVCRNRLSVMQVSSLQKPGTRLFLLLKSIVMLADSGTESEKKKVFMPVEVSHSPDLLNAFPPEAEGLLGHFWSLGSIKN